MTGFIKAFPPGLGWLLRGLLVLGVACGHGPKARVSESALAAELSVLESVGPRRLTPSGGSHRVVLVHFFATWCFPCATELPTFEALHRRFESQGLTVIGVGMDLEGARVLTPFVQFQALSYPVVVAGERIRSGTSLFGPIRALPTTFVLGRDGSVLAAYDGTASPHALEAMVTKALRDARPEDR